MNEFDSLDEKKQRLYDWLGHLLVEHHTGLVFIIMGLLIVVFGVALLLKYWNSGL